MIVIDEKIVNNISSGFIKVIGSGNNSIQLNNFIDSSDSYVKIRRLFWTTSESIEIKNKSETIFELCGNGSWDSNIIGHFLSNKFKDIIEVIINGKGTLIMEVSKLETNTE